MVLKRASQPVFKKGPGKGQKTPTKSEICQKKSRKMSKQTTAQANFDISRLLFCIKELNCGLEFNRLNFRDALELVREYK